MRLPRECILGQPAIFQLLLNFLFLLPSPYTLTSLRQIGHELALRPILAGTLAAPQEHTFFSSGNTLRYFSARDTIPWGSKVELESVDAGVPALACRHTFNSGSPFSVDDPKGNSEGSRPGIYTREEDAPGCGS